MSASTLLQFLTQALFVVVFVVVAVKAVRQPRRATIDTALLFGVVSLLVAEGWVVAALHWKPNPLLTAFLSSLIMALPYLLLRLINDFAGVPGSVMRGAALGLAAATVASFALQGRAAPGWLALLYVAYFVALTLYGTVVVVRAARQSGGVTRRRLQAVAAGSLGLGLAILVAGAQVAFPAWAAWWSVLANLFALASGLGYLIGFAPPRWLRQAWQGPELRAFLGRTASFSHLPDTDTIVHELERGTASSLGAPAALISLWDEEAGVLRGTIGREPYEIRPGRLISGQAFADQRALFSNDVGQDSPAHVEQFAAPGASAVLAAPITVGTKRIGVLAAYALQAPLFAEDDLVLLQVLADQAAVVLENRVLIDQMARVSRVKSEFLANMSHELRTPLNAIIGFSEVLHDGTFGSLNDRQRRYLGNVLEAGRHLLGLVNDVLDISKVEAGRMELHYEDVEVTALLEEVSDTMRPLAQQKEIDLRLGPAKPAQFEGNAWTFARGDQRPTFRIRVDRARFLQVLYNLLSNALKFTPTGGTVMLNVTPLSGSVAIAVTDSGIGIAPEDLARIFDEFQQVDSSVARAQQGTGLGLALTRRLVELHGGTITVQSSPGQGSTFTVTLPRLEPAAPAAPESTEAAAAPPAEPVKVPSGIRGEVLVVEDQAAARELLSLYLGEAGYGVRSVDRAANVLPRAREIKPVAITLDLMLGNEVAWRVLEQLKADVETRDIPVVIVSILEEQATGFALGAAAYLVKPVARQDLLGALERVACADGRPLKVLAVDDQPEALELIALALEDGSYALTRAGSGDEALRQLAGDRPDVLIVDLMMAPVSGFDVIAAVAGDADLCDIPIIVLTGRDLTAEDLARLNGHILTALPKRGFSKAQFLREVERATRVQKKRPSDHALGMPA